MPLITLTTEWNNNDTYIGAVKGRILSMLPNANIVDISHQVPALNILRAAYIIKNSYHNFPKGTVHIIGVRSEASDLHKHIIVEHDGHFFIGADNGIFGIMFEQKPEKIIAIENFPKSTFPEADIFADVACKILQGENIDNLGTVAEKVYRLLPILPTIDKGVIDGTVIYIDSYQNAITNITSQIFYDNVKDHPFEILLENMYTKITKINTAYNQTKPGDLLAIFNSSGLLELAQYNGKLSEATDIKLSSTIRIKYYDNKNS